MATEDLTTYTEVDTSSRLTVTSSSVTVSSLARSETAYVYKDFGADYFAGDFSVRFQMNVSSVSGELAGIVIGAFGDTLGTLTDLLGGDCVYINVLYLSSNLNFTLAARSGGASQGSDSTVLSTSTDYYFEYTRTGTSFTCDIYDDSGYSNLVDSLTLTLGSGDSYRYCYATNCSVYADADTISGVYQDLELFLITQYEIPLLDLNLALQVPGYSPVAKLIPVLPLSLDMQAPTLQVSYTVPVLPLDLVMQAPTTSHLYNTPLLDFTLGLNAPTMLASVGAPLLALDLALQIPTFVWDDSTGEGTVIYYCVLTGDGDSLDDVTLPLENFQSRLRSGSPSYLQVTIPDPYTYSASISARTNGDIVVYRGVRFADGGETVAEIARANLESIADDRGAENSSIQLVGHKQTTTETPKTRNVVGLIYYHTGTGARRAKTSVLDTHLRPGDTVVFPEFGDESFVVGLVSYVVSARFEQMDLTEDV